MYDIIIYVVFIVHSTYAPHHAVSHRSANVIDETRDLADRTKFQYPAFHNKETPLSTTLRQEG